MSYDTEATISYGVTFQKGYKFPWLEKIMGDYLYCELEAWWLVENGFDLSMFYADDDSNFKTDESYVLYNKSLEEFPIAFSTFNYGNEFNSSYLLAITSTQLEPAVPNGATKFNPQLLKVTELQTKQLLDFCEKYNLIYEDGPAWFLATSEG